MIGCLTETTTCVVAKPLVSIKLGSPIDILIYTTLFFVNLYFLLRALKVVEL